MPFPLLLWVMSVGCGTVFLMVLLANLCITYERAKCDKFISWIPILWEALQINRGSLRTTTC